MTKIKLLATSIVAFGVFSLAAGMNEQSNNEKNRFCNNHQTTMDVRDIDRPTSLAVLRTTFGMPTSIADLHTPLEITTNTADLRTPFGMPTSIVDLYTPSGIPTNTANLHTPLGITTNIADLHTPFGIPTYHETQNNHINLAFASLEFRAIASWLMSNNEKLKQKAYNAVKNNPENYFLYTKEEFNYIKQKRTGRYTKQYTLEGKINDKRLLLHTLKKYDKKSKRLNVREALLDIIDEQIRLLCEVVGNKTQTELENARNSVPCMRIKTLLYFNPAGINDKLKKKFNIRERATLGLFALDHYTLFLASMHFETLDDHINLVIASPNFSGNMEKFHYNPVSLDEETLKFFPNMQTLYVYDENDKYLEGGKIWKYVDWNGMYASEALEERDTRNKDIIFKNVTLDNEVRDLFIKEIEEKNSVDLVEFERIKKLRIVDLNITFPNHLYALEKIIVPNHITKIKKILIEELTGFFRISPNTDENSANTREIILNTSIDLDGQIHQYVIKLPEIVANNCMDLCGWRSDTPINVDKTIEDNKLFFYMMLTDCLLSSIDPWINSSILKYVSIIVPDGITGLSRRCFSKYHFVEKIELPTTLKEIGDYCFNDCVTLDIPELPTRLTRIGFHAFSTYSRIKYTDFFERKCLKEYQNRLYHNNNIGITYDDFILSKSFTGWEYYNYVRIIDIETRRKKEDLFFAIKELELKSFGPLEFADAQNMSEFAEAYPELSYILLAGDWPEGDEELISLEIPTIVTALSSPISCLASVSSISLPSTIAGFGKKIVTNCWKLKKLILPLNMQYIILPSSDCAFFGNTFVTSVCIEDSKGSTEVTFAESQNPTENIYNALRQVGELKDLDLEKKILRSSNFAFWNNTSLNSVCIKDSTGSTEIAFAQSQNPTENEDNALRQVSELKNLDLKKK